MLETLKSLFYDVYNSFTIMSVIDILLTAFLIYKILDWIRGTQAMKVAKGVVIILLATQVSDWIGLITINYILKNIITVGFIALIVMFQPELRRGLERIGSTKFYKLFKSFSKSNINEDILIAVNETVSAVKTLSETKTGALIIFERHIKLRDIIETGVQIDAVPSKDLYINIFTPNTPLHDGAVIISNTTMRIAAAGCLLPLTQNKSLNTEIGTRHRAGIGVSENSDCFSVIVSEETGVISYSVNGKLSRFVDPKTLKTLLMQYLEAQETASQKEQRKAVKEK